MCFFDVRFAILSVKMDDRSDDEAGDDIQGMGKMKGGMMAARRMAAVHAVVPRAHCIEGVASFLSHYLPPEKGLELVRRMRPGISNDDIFHMCVSIIGGRHSRLTAYTGPNWNTDLDRFFVDVQEHKRMGYYTSQYEYTSGGVGGHITGFLWDPETGTVAFFEPREQGAAGDRCSFFVRHVDVLKYKAGPAMRGDAEGKYRGLFGEYAILNTAYSRGPLSPMFKQVIEGAIKSHIVTEMVIFDTVPKIYEGEASAESSGAFHIPMTFLPLSGREAEYYPEDAWRDAQIAIQGSMGSVAWNALSDDVRRQTIVQKLRTRFPSMLHPPPDGQEERVWQGWDSEAAAAASAAAGPAAPMAGERDEDQIPTPKIDAMEGKGMPQHTEGRGKPHHHRTSLYGAGGPPPRAPRANHPGTGLDQKIANQTPIHTTGEVRGRTPIHIVTN